LVIGNAGEKLLELQYTTRHSQPIVLIHFYCIPESGADKKTAGAASSGGIHTYLILQHF
jgi:hypothetical protein